MNIFWPSKISNKDQHNITNTNDMETLVVVFQMLPNLRYINFVFLALILRPTILAFSSNFLVFSCIWSSVCDNSAINHQYSLYPLVWYIVSISVRCHLLLGLGMCYVICALYNYHWLGNENNPNRRWHRTEMDTMYHTRGYRLRWWFSAIITYWRPYARKDSTLCCIASYVIKGVYCIQLFPFYKYDWQFLCVEVY
jgi:hypothetical protein